MKTVLFIDQCCPNPYDQYTLYNKAQGGTESTVTRVAEGLASTGLFSVVVEQHNRKEVYKETKVAYSPLGTSPVADYVICLRLPGTMLYARERFPMSKTYLWCHDLWDEAMAKAMVPIINDTGTKYILCVSNYHKVQVLNSLFPVGIKVKANFVVTYPPLDPSLKHYTGPFDKNQLAWFSSPHKGLEGALSLFSKLRDKDPSFKLVVHNPGYFENYEKKVPDGVEIRPIGKYQDAIDTVKTSLCVFYPNTVFPETFGLVYSEANQLGVPVLAYPLGAAAEALDHPKQFVDCTKPDLVIEKILAWKNGDRPIVRGKGHFKLTTTIREWIFNLLT